MAGCKKIIEDTGIIPVINITDIKYAECLKKKLAFLSFTL